MIDVLRDFSTTFSPYIVRYLFQHKAGTGLWHMCLFAIYRCNLMQHVLQGVSQYHHACLLCCRIFATFKIARLGTWFRTLRKTFLWLFGSLLWSLSVIFSVQSRQIVSVHTQTRRGKSARHYNLFSSLKLGFLSLNITETDYWSLSFLFS